MSINVIIELFVKEDRAADIPPLFSELLPQTRNSAGNEGVTVMQSLSASTNVLLFEQWASQEDYNAYMAWRAQRGDFDRIAQLLKQPLQRRIFKHFPV